MYELTKTFGGTIDARTGARIRTPVQHDSPDPLSSPGATRLGREPGSWPSRGAPRIDLGSTETEARAALAAFNDALNYATAYFGWPTVVVDDPAATIEATIPTF